MNRLQRLMRAEPVATIAVPAWLERIASVGIVSRDPQVIRRQRFTNVVAYAAAANAASHLVINGVYEPYALAPVHAYNAIFAGAALLVHRLHRVGENAAAHTLLSLVTVGTLFVIWMFGRNSQLHVYFTLAGVILFMFGVEHTRLFAAWFGLAFVSLLASLQLAPPEGLLIPEDRALREMLAGHAMVNAIFINGLVIYYVVAALRRTELALEDQYTRYAALAETVLPARIAARLIYGGEERIADRVENLTVLFADLVDFTKAAHDLPPEQVVDYLDDFVRTFDALCTEFGVEKIKTIGDSYMAAGGLRGASRDGALAIGRLALAMREAQAERGPLSRERLRLRIGVHTGAATAGVIGDTRFSYDVWGDAVNVASRMESHGVPDRIHVSAEFRAAAEGAFVFEERGITEIRGIGPVRTYFLLRPAGTQ